jgi:hypothetical protein
MQFLIATHVLTATIYSTQKNASNVLTSSSDIIFTIVSIVIPVETVLRALIVKIFLIALVVTILMLENI